MALYVEIPQDEHKLKQSIQSLEWQLTQENDEKSKNILKQTLDMYKEALNNL